MTTKTSDWNQLEVGGMGCTSLSCTDRQARWQGAVLLVVAALLGAQSTSEWVSWRTSRGEGWCRCRESIWSGHTYGHL